MVATYYKKAILHANRDYHSPDGVVRATPARLKQWEANHKRLTAANYAAPTAWDHAADLAGASPVKLSRKGELPSAEKTVGRLHEFKVAADGNSAEITLAITDPKAKGRVKRNEVYVSPIIMDKWQDGAKNIYEDVITHVDLVTWPVDNSQTPFVPVEPGTIACGIRMGLSRMAFPDPDDEKDDDLGDDDTDPIEEGEEAPESKPLGNKNPDAPPAATDNSKTEAVLTGLKQKNIVLPSDFDFTADGAIDIFLAAINSALAAELAAGPKEEPEEEEDSSQGDDVMQVQDPGYAAMSLQAKSAFSYAEKQYRGGIATRMSTLLASGRCTPAEATAKDTEVKAVKLSLDATSGEPAKSNLELWIESREAVPAGTFWSPEVRTQKLGLQVEELPANAGGSSAEEDQRIVDWALGRKKK